MDPKEYRREYEEAMARHVVADPATGGLRAGFAFVAGAADTLDTGIARDLDTLSDEAAPAPGRLAALRSLKAARFSGPRFARYWPGFVNALRHLLVPGTDSALLAEAAEVLAGEKDRPTQELLRRGLEDPAAALVPPAMALEFLGYDDHEDAGRLALQIFRSNSDLTTREAALRVLGSTPEAADTFAAVMTDKAQPRSLRALGAAGLNHADPERFARLAEQVIGDDGDFPEVQATSRGIRDRSGGPAAATRAGPIADGG